MRIERELMAPAEMITAPGHPEMRQAIVAVRWEVAAPTVEVVEEEGEVVATVDVMRSRGEDMEEIMKVEVEVAEETTGERVRGLTIGGMTEGREAGEEEEEEEGKEVVEEEGMEVLHGQAQATALLLQSRVGEEATADLAVEEAVGTLPPSPIGVTEVGLEAQMCPRTALCSRWGEASTQPLQSPPSAIPFPLLPLAQGLREATQAPVGTDLMLTTRTQ